MNPRAVAVERRLNPLLLVAALLTIPALVLDNSGAHGVEHTIGSVGGAVIWGVFLLEVIIMLGVVDSRRQWIREHPIDLAIVVLTPPFLFAAIQGLRVLRVLRLLRLAPVMRRLFTSEGLKHASVFALVVLLVSAEMFSSVEHISYGNALYWAITTMTTVGYGDITPHTATGKIDACMTMLVGIGFFAILTGSIAQRFLATEVRQLELDEDDLVTQIRRISDQLRLLEQAVQKQADRASG